MPITEDTVRSWPGPGTAAHGLIADGTRYALVGGYGNDRDRLLVGNLDQGHFRPYRLTLPGGRAMPNGLRLIARGADLHAFAETTWYRLHLNDLP